MNFGMFTDFHIGENRTQAEAFDESFAQIADAETMGFDTVWLAEHHFSPERAVLASPMVIASAIAARTNRIRTGLAVQVLPLTNPLRVAEEAATVDHISKGRFEFGIGRSGLTKYYQGYNIPYAESRPRFLEALDIIMQAWSNDEFSYDGQFHSYQDVAVVPKPYQQPYPPVRVAVAGEDTFPLIGKMGHPIFVSANTGREQLQERIASYEEARAASGPHRTRRHRRPHPRVRRGDHRKGALGAGSQRHVRHPVRGQRVGQNRRQRGDRRAHPPHRQHALRRRAATAGGVRHAGGNRRAIPGIPGRLRRNRRRHGSQLRRPDPLQPGAELAAAHQRRGHAPLQVGV